MDAASVKQQAQFMAWGMPIIYVATAGLVLAAFVPHFRANAGYLKLHITGYVGKLAIFSAVNMICSIFLFWSPAIHYSLINFLLSFLVLCTISIPTFPKDFARPLALIFFIWTMIFTGIAPVNSSSQGILTVLSLSNCNVYYKYEPTVMDKICKDGWITFTVFCGIITVGLTFLSNLLLISVGFDQSLQGEAEGSQIGQGHDHHAGSGYQQPTVPVGGNGEYQSYQNAENVA